MRYGTIREKLIRKIRQLEGASKSPFSFANLSDDETGEVRFQYVWAVNCGAEEAADSEERAEQLRDARIRSQLVPE